MGILQRPSRTTALKSACNPVGLALKSGACVPATLRLRNASSPGLETKLRPRGAQSKGTEGRLYTTYDNLGGGEW